MSRPEFNDRIAELEAKAKRAGELHRLLEELADADPYKRGRKVDFSERDPDDSLALRVLTESTLRKVIAIGVETLRKQTEDELTALLG